VIQVPRSVVPSCTEGGRSSSPTLSNLGSPLDETRVPDPYKGEISISNQFIIYVVRKSHRGPRGTKRRRSISSERSDGGDD
jgi:hypothetical protein